MDAPLTGRSEEPKSYHDRLWAKYVDEEAPDVFSFLHLAKDGGFSEVGQLYTSSRWISCLMLVIFVLYNVEAVVVLDISFMQNATAAVMSMDADDPTLNPNKINGAFYFSSGIVDYVVGKIQYNAGITPHNIPAVSVLGMFELVGLSYFLLKAIFRGFQIKCCEGYKRWYAVKDVVWEIAPILSTYSAMKLLNEVVPSVATARVFEMIANYQEASAAGKSKAKPIMAMILWVFTVVFSFIVGFDTFLMKMRVVALKASDTTLSLSTVLPCVQFLVQVLGVVQLGPFVRARLFQFIFGGEDGILQEEEIELKDTWEALLAKRMYREYSFSHFIATMMSFSDEDFQSLVLNENQDEKAKLAN